jgi:pyruvate,orthophosphate dikinase
MEKKRVYTFGNGAAEGRADMKNLLGGKGANLAEMNLIGVPVPPGFTITTEVCTEYNELGRDYVINVLKGEVEDAIIQIEKLTGTKFGDKDNPLLVSVRSGARVSMPGMMDTVLNLGLNDDAVEGIAKKSGNERFAWDSYRRFVQMYGDVVLGMKPHSKEDIDPFEEIMEEMKASKGIELDTEFTTDDLKQLVKLFKAAVKEKTGKEFPVSPWDQLWGSVCAVFDSWMNERAILYRKMNNFPEEWGTAVNVQAMVYGNMGKTSGTGVAFTRDAATGENIFNGEYLIDAQGEDVVSGVRTPQQITTEGSRRWAKLQGISEEERSAKYPSLEEVMPECAAELIAVQQKLEDYFKDMQDLEFTIQDGKLWLLQTRSGKRTGAAMIKIAIDMLHEGYIDEKTVLKRCDPEKLDELLHPVFDKNALAKAKPITHGLPASPGAAAGQVVFHADEAEEWSKEGKQVILCRIETSPEDLRGMNSAQGILTSRGGMTSHAAVVARGMGKCCVSAANNLIIDYKTRSLSINGKEIKEGDWLSLDGSTGYVYEGKIATQDADLDENFDELMSIAEKYARMDVRTNADTPKDAAVARKFGAKGIGLCRTEHMFFEEDKIVPMREMILSKDEEGRRKALEKLLPLQKKDFLGIFRAMDGLPVTVRLLDLQCISCHLDAGHYNPNYAHGQMVGIPGMGGSYAVDTSLYFKESTPVNSFTNFREQIPGTAVSFNMIAIEGGTFMMGSPEKEPFRKPDESPQHEVTVSPFFMAEVETTWDQYWAFYAETMSEGRTPPEVVYENNLKALGVDAISGPTPPFGYPDQGWGQGDRPAITMTHYAAETYCQWLSEKTGKKYRLPTEAEWEYAARGGTETAYFFKGNPKELWEEFIPENYRNEIENKGDSLLHEMPGYINIDSSFQQRHFKVD